MSALKCHETAVRVEAVAFHEVAVVAVVVVVAFDRRLGRRRTLYLSPHDVN